MSENPRARYNNDDNVASFETFFRAWLVRQEHLLDELISAQENHHQSRDEDLKELVKRVLAHYQQYYQEKSKVAQHNVFLLFAPTWFTPFEQTFFWIAGFNPTLAFRVVNESVKDLADEQRQRMDSLSVETRVEEKLLNDELARIQESVAGPTIMELARRRGQLGEWEMTEGVEVTESNLRASLESLVANADMLRTTTTAKVVEILDPLQNVKFFTAVARLQLRIRRWASHGESEKDES